MRAAAAVPLGRMGDPAEIRGLALPLASSAKCFLTGGEYPVDGGQLRLLAPSTDWRWQRFVWRFAEQGWCR